MNTDKSKKTMGITIRVDEDTFKTLSEIATIDRRTLSDVARLLLERGVLAYRVDGELFEGYKPGREKAPPIKRRLASGE